MNERASRPGEESRVPLEQPIALRFKLLDEFVQEPSANLSTGGMFVRTDRPHPVGSVFDFEFRPDSGQEPLTGKAQVVWIRRRGGDVERPAGMGVRFVEMSDESRRVIQRVVDRQQGAVPAPAVPAEEPVAAEAANAPRPAPEPPPAAAAAAAATAARPRPDAVPRPAPAATAPAWTGRAASRPPSPIRRRLWILLPAALALAAVAVLWLRPVTPESGPAPAGLETAAGAEPAAETAPAAPAAAVPDEPTSLEAGPAETVDAWAKAWSEQRVDDYLSAYSRSFDPPGGLSRDDWERQRRSRLLAPEWIKVELAFVEVEAIGDARRRVRFVQAYESNTYRDLVLKALELERQGGAWRIVRETVEP